MAETALARESDNFYRLSRLLRVVGTKIVQGLFDSIHDPSTLPQILQTNLARLNHLKGNNLPSDEEMELLFPSETTYGESKYFNLTLLLKLLRNICKLTEPATGWDKFPNDNDLSLEADLARIKYYNVHIICMESTEHEFNDLWSQIQDALLRIVHHYSPLSVDKWRMAIEKRRKAPISSEDRTVEFPEFRAPISSEDRTVLNEFLEFRDKWRMAIEKTHTALISSEDRTVLNEFPEFRDIFKPSLQLRDDKLHSYILWKQIGYSEDASPCENSHLQDIESIFLPEESLYEALSRDGRFVRDKLRDYDLEIPIENDKRVMVSVLAKNFAEHEFKCARRRNENLSLEVQPYKDERGGKPADRVKAGTSGVIVKEETSEEREECSSGTTITSDQELLDFIEEFLSKSKNDPQNEKNRLEKIDMLFETSYNNYALNEKHHLYAADHRFIVDVCDSVGAVVLMYTSKTKAFKGTCFRIGTQFVLTNMHVVDLINEKSSLLENVFIDFDHGESSRMHRVFLCDRDQYSAQGKFVPLVSSTELDYAVLKLVPIDVPLPPSLTGMFSLPISNQHLQEGIFLTFVGHPRGDKTATNLCCPVRNPGNLAKEFAITLSRQNMATYDVSTFLNGTSGSPGFLIKERILMVMHTRGACLDKKSGRAVEQGVMMSAIVADVCYKIKCGLLSYQFKELFGMEIPQ